MHFHPQPAQRILQQKFDNPIRRKKLRDGGNLIRRKLPSRARGRSIRGFQRRCIDRLIDSAKRVIVSKQRNQIRREVRAHRGPRHGSGDLVQQRPRASKTRQQFRNELVEFSAMQSCLSTLIP